MIVVVAVLATAVPAGAQQSAGPDAAPTGSNAPRPDPAPVKSTPKVTVVRPAARPVVTTTARPATPVATTPVRRASKPVHRATTHRKKPVRHQQRRRRRSAARRRGAPAPAPEPRAPQRTPDERRRSRAQARRRRPLAPGPGARECDVAGVHRAGRAAEGGAVRRAVLLAVLGLAVWAPGALALPPRSRRRSPAQLATTAGTWGSDRQLDDHAAVPHRLWVRRRPDLEPTRTGTKLECQRTTAMAAYLA